MPGPRVQVVAGRGSEVSPNGRGPEELIMEGSSGPLFSSIRVSFPKGRVQPLEQEIHEPPVKKPELVRAASPTRDE